MLKHVTKYVCVAFFKVTTHTFKKLSQIFGNDRRTLVASRASMEPSRKTRVPGAAGKDATGTCGDKGSGPGTALGRHRQRWGLSQCLEAIEQPSSPSLSWGPEPHSPEALPYLPSQMSGNNV